MRIVHSILFLVPGVAFVDEGDRASAPAPVPAAEARPAPDLLSAVPASADFAVAVHDSAGFLSELRPNAWYRVLHDERLWGPDEGPEAFASEFLHLLGPLGADGAELLQPVLESSRALVFVADFHVQPSVAPGNSEPGNSEPGNSEPGDSESGNSEPGNSEPGDSEPGIALALVARPGSDGPAFESAWEALLQLGRDPDAAESAAATAGTAPEHFSLGGWTVLGRRLPDGDALIVLARSADAVQPLAAEVAQGLAELRPAPDWVLDARASAPAGVQVEVFARLSGIPWSHLELGQRATELYRALGIDRVRWAYAGLRVGVAEEFDLHLALHVPEDAALGAMLAQLRPVDPALYRIVPAEALSASFTSIDVGGLWRLVTALLEERMPEQFAVLESSLAELGEQLEIDPLEDLLYLLGGDSIEWTTSAPAAESVSGEPYRAHARDGARVHDAAILTLTDSERFDDSLSHVLDEIGIKFALSKHEHRNHVVTSLGLDAEGGGFFWAFPSGAVVFGSEQEAVNLALDRWEDRDAPDASSLLDNPVLGPRVRAVEKAFHIAAFDTAAVLRELLELVETFDEVLQGGLSLGLELGSFRLPFPGVVDEYFEGSVLAYARNASGRVVLHISGR